jgi:hypothetical protein
MSTMAVMVKRGFVLMAGGCLVIAASTLFAAQASMHITDDKDSKTADNKHGEGEKTVEQVLQLLGVLKSVQQGTAERPEAVALLEEQINKLVGDIAPIALVPLIIQRIELNAKVRKEALAVYDYTVMNQAHDDKDWQVAFFRLCAFVDEQYNQKTQAKEWRNLVMRVWGERCSAAMHAKSHEFFIQYVTDVFNARHASGGQIDADFAIASYEGHAKAWIECVQKAADEARKQP